MKQITLYFAAFATSITMFSCSTGNQLATKNSDLEVSMVAPQPSVRILTEETPVEIATATISAIEQNNAELSLVEHGTEVTTAATEPVNNIELFSNGLKELVANTDNKFARKSLTKQSDHLDKLTGNKEKLSLMDKLKIKMFNKILKRYVAKRGGTMDTADILAIVSLCAGILTWVTYYGSFLFGIGAIVTGVIALKRGTSRRGMALAGIILGAIGLFFWLMLFLFVIAVFAVI